MQAAVTPQIAHKALRILFGADSVQASDVVTLATLSQREVAVRFRARALELHPDRAGALGEPSEILERRFKQLHGAYRLLSRLVDDESLKRQVLVDARHQGLGSEGDGLWHPSPSGSTTSGPGRRSGPWSESPDPRTGGTTANAKAGSAAVERDSGRGMYYSGRVPEGELRFAQFLYYHRVIDWRTMIDAITWQYRVRPKVGEIGRAYRFLDFQSVSKVLRTSPQGELFGNTAMRIGILDRRQLHVVLGKQHQLNYPIGRYFLENEILSRPEIDHMLMQNRRHNLRYRRR